YLELWEIGLARVGMRDAASGMRDVASWLKALYQVPSVVPEIFDSYLHDAPVERIPTVRESFRASRIPHLAVVVVALRDAPRAADRRPALGSPQRAAGIAGPRSAARWRALCEPRVWPAGRRARAPGPAAPHAPCRRGALASGFRYRLVRESRSLLVPLYAGAQRPAGGRRDAG